MCCHGLNELNAARKISTNDLILKGRRIVEFSVLIEGLSNCAKCLSGPLYLSLQTVKAEMKVGLAGYLYVQCTYCGNVNRVPYGEKQKVTGQIGMPSFCVNTKFGAGSYVTHSYKEKSSFFRIFPLQLCITLPYSSMYF